MKTQYIEEFEQMPRRIRQRLLKRVRELGAWCAREAYRRDQYPYRIDANDRYAVKALLVWNNVHQVPRESTANQHPIWDAFWRGVADVPAPEPEAEE